MHRHDHESGVESSPRAAGGAQGLAGRVLVVLAGLLCSACSGGAKSSDNCQGAACGQAGLAAEPDASVLGPADAAGAEGSKPSDAGHAVVVVPEGACVPDGPSADALGSARSILLMGSRRLAAVASTTSGLFVSDLDAGILRIPKAGTAVELVVAATGVADFLAADLHLYWFQTNAIYKASLTASDAVETLVADGLLHPVSFLNYDATNLYFADGQDMTLMRLPLTGGPAATIAHGVAAQDLKLRVGLLYYSDAGTKQVYRLSTKAGSTSERLTSGANSAPLAVETDGTTLYWVDDTQILSMPIGKPAATKSLGVGGPGKLAGLGRIVEMKLLTDRLYWRDDAGNLGWTAIDASRCALVVKAAGEIQGWDVDQDAVYLAVGATSSALWQITR